MNLERTKMSLERTKMSLERSKMNLERTEMSLEGTEMCLEGTETGLEGTEMNLEALSSYWWICVNNNNKKDIMDKMEQSGILRTHSEKMKCMMKSISRFCIDIVNRMKRQQNTQKINLQTWGLGVQQ
jgi:hypothetical protein